jgi:hypothetical protein
MSFTLQGQNPEARIMLFLMRIRHFPICLVFILIRARRLIPRNVMKKGSLMVDKSKKKKKED